MTALTGDNLDQIVKDDLRLMVVIGSFYDIDQGAEPDFYIDDPENFYNRKALTDYINKLF